MIRFQQYLLAKILALNLVYTFLLFNFLIIGLFNYSASCSFTLTPDPIFLSKNKQTILAKAL